jgi:hemoglobin/transferrin/lactoferrin receptor protein
MIRISRPRPSSNRGRSVLALAVSLAFPIAHAEEEIFLPVVETVAAIRSSGVAEDSPRSVSVVEAKTLAERPGMNGIQAALEEVPGIQFARSGGLGGQIVMRGFNSNHARSIVTVDGDRYRGRTTLEFNMFDPNAIERIEVIRGPASALYGADAMNGVINIVTRRARVERDAPFSLAPRLRALEYASVNDLWGTRLELVGGGAGFDVMIGAHYRGARDFDTPEGRARNSDFESRGLDFNIGYSPSAESRWALSGRYQNVTTGRAGGLGAAPGAPIQEVSEDPIVEKYLRLAYQGKNFAALADTLDASLYVREFETDIYQKNRSNPAVTVAPHLKVYTPTVWGGHLVAMKGVGEHLLSYGGDFFREDFYGRKRQITRTDAVSGALIGQTDWEHIDRHSWQTNIGVFVSDEWQTSERWTLSGALRYDRVHVRIGHAVDGETPAITEEFERHRENTDSAFTGNLGAVYKLTPVWSLAANLSRGFRAPSGNERTITSTAGTITTLPSPDLKAEYNDTLELGLRWNAGAARGSLTAYESRYTDLITTRVLTPVLRQRLNVGDAVIRGLELEGSNDFARRWRLAYMLTATRGTDESSHRPLPGIAPLAARLALRYQQDGWYVEGVTRGYKGKTRVDTTQERKGSSYAMVDLHAGVSLDRFIGARGWKLVAGVENLFDRLGRNPAVAEDIAYPHGGIANPLAEPGRNFVLKLTSDI